MPTVPFKIVAGIDPGKSGALAVTYPDGTVRFFDVPRIKLKNKDRPAWSEWGTTWIDALWPDFDGPIDMIVIEDVSTRPNEGRVAAFNFGRTLGFAHALAISIRPRPVIHFVTPSIWKAKLGLLNSDKGASREKCRTLYPGTAKDLGRVKDDGRAEAALIAHYGRKYLQ